MNFNRFQKVLAWHLIGGKNHIQATILRIAAGTGLIAVVGNISGWINHNLSAININQDGAMCAVALVIAMIFLAGEVNFNMKTKDSIVNYAMLPASNLEKYLANILYKTILAFILFLAGMAIADVCQNLVSLILGCECGSMTLAMFNTIGAAISDVSVSATVAFIFIHSTYVLGSCLFRKRAILMTTLTWISIPFAITAIMVGGATVIQRILEDSDTIVTVHFLLSDAMMDGIITVVVALLSIFNYWMGYRLFSRIQVINNRFFN